MHILNRELWLMHKKWTKPISSRSIPVNKSSLTTIDIFQLKILANRQRINVNWYK